MSLTKRILLFVLATLAVVLATFSTTLYVLADRYLHRSAADRAASAMETLRAAVEMSADGLEWEPHERLLRFHRGPFGDDLQWRVTDETGRLVDRSPDDDLLPDESSMPDLAAGDPAPPRRPSESALIVRKTISAPELLPADKAARPRKAASLNLSVGLSLAPIQALLNRLAVALVAVSAIVWTVVLLIGRFLCRSALAPLTRMAAATRAISAERLDVRLPRPETADELADLGQAFNALLDRLQEAFERQRQFTSEASHQLRTPLTAILGQVEVALRRERSGDEYRRALAVVQGQGAHLRRLVESLLYLARADADARLPDLGPLELFQWAPKCLAEWSSHPRSADVHWAPTAEGPCWINANPAMLSEAVKNLIDNALKYSDPGRPVEVGLQASAGRVSLSVADRGEGISAADQQHLFKPFFRSAVARRRGAAGVGLGLAVVARLVKAMGGCVECTSQLGEGSCFTVVFPKTANDARRALSTRSSKPQLSGACDASCPGGKL